MNVLVTGGAGYIGSHTCVELLEAGHTPIVVDNLCNSSEVSLQRSGRSPARRWSSSGGTCGTRPCWTRSWKQYRPACAIHFAGLKAVGESVEKPLAYYDQHLRSTLSLCRAMARAGVKRIIFSSSATVYSGDNEMPLGEDAPHRRVAPTPTLRPSTCASRSSGTPRKRTPSGPWCCCGTSTPWAPTPAASSARPPTASPTTSCPYISQTAIGRLPELRVFGNDYPTRDGHRGPGLHPRSGPGQGPCGRHPPPDGAHGEAVFNLGTGQGYSVLEMVEAFQRVNQVSVPYPHRPPPGGGSGGMLRRPVQERPGAGLEGGAGPWRICAGDAWNWQKKNPNGYEA